ncbi:hypothetical protein [Micromonospora avicenniae]|uniref:hypothetical protein n=1 Tax=Micromonospora avicenniae TaxID=1198245 RepID=UPI00344AE2F4
MKSFVRASGLALAAIAVSASFTAQPAAAQPAAAARPAHGTTSPSVSKFFGPYNTLEECLDVQAAVIEQGGIVVWHCAPTSVTIGGGSNYMFAAYV